MQQIFIRGVKGFQLRAIRVRNPDVLHLGRVLEKQRPSCQLGLKPSPMARPSLVKTCIRFADGCRAGCGCLRFVAETQIALRRRVGKCFQELRWH